MDFRLAASANQSWAAAVRHLPKDYGARVAHHHSFRWSYGVGMSDVVQNSFAPTLTDGITRLPGQQRYVYVVGGEQVGLADYRMAGDAMHIVHTEVCPAQRGSGLGARLVQRVLDAVREETHYRVVADCPFVAEFIDRHPQYRQLTDRGL